MIKKLSFEVYMGLIIPWLILYIQEEVTFCWCFKIKLSSVNQQLHLQNTNLEGRKDGKYFMWNSTNHCWKKKVLFYCLLVWREHRWYKFLNIKYIVMIFFISFAMFVKAEYRGLKWKFKFHPKGWGTIDIVWGCLNEGKMDQASPAFMPAAFLFLLATRRAQNITYLSNSSLTIKIQLRYNFFLSFPYDNSLRIRFLLELFLKISSISLTLTLAISAILVSFRGQGH